MNVKEVYSADIYERIMNAEDEQKTEIYRFELMKPFKKKWECYNIPLKAKIDGGYDVIMASDMLGFLTPGAIKKEYADRIQLLKREGFWSACQQSIEKSLQCFMDNGIELKVNDYLYTILLANPESPYSKLNEGYCGDGGIPGYIFASLVPNEYTMKRLPALLAHECNHNVRFQYIKWRNDITLAEMMISEGLAENFAVSLYGEENIGPWVSKTDKDMLNDYIKPIIKDALDAKGFENITAYLWGDETANMQGYFPVGLPYCAGYVCGYHMVKYYLDKTGDDITHATIRAADVILNEIEDFWNEK